jgi:hypothetical protein
MAAKTAHICSQTTHTLAPQTHATKWRPSLKQLAVCRTCASTVLQHLCQDNNGYKISRAMVCFCLLPSCFAPTNHTNAHKAYSNPEPLPCRLANRCPEILQLCITHMIAMEGWAMGKHVQMKHVQRRRADSKTHGIAPSPRWARSQP